MQSTQPARQRLLLLTFFISLLVWGWGQACLADQPDLFTPQPASQTVAPPDDQPFAPQLPRPPLLPEWETLAPGLDLSSLNGTLPAYLQIIILRIDPEYYDFSLHGPLWNANKALTIEEWARQENLLAVINAGMFLPDQQTPTGYARVDGEDHGLHLAGKYGGFFVSQPLLPDLPRAAILDRTVDDVEALLPHFLNVAQNFRLLGPDGEQLWPENGPGHAMSVVGQDLSGKILFIHCRGLTNVHGLVSALRQQPSLNLQTAIYMEGGSQAGLCLNLPDYQKTWSGRLAMDIMLRGQAGASALPFVLGIRARDLRIK